MFRGDEGGLGMGGTLRDGFQKKVSPFRGAGRGQGDRKVCWSLNLYIVIFCKSLVTFVFSALIFFISHEEL